MKVSGKFQVRSTFALKERCYFVLLGNVVDGVIKEGMEILFPFNSSLSMHPTIHSIESVRSADGTNLGLTIKCDSTEELDLWTSLGVKDETLEIRTKVTP